MSERLRREVELQETTFLPREVNNKAYLRCRRLASRATHFRCFPSWEGTGPGTGREGS